MLDRCERKDHDPVLCGWGASPDSPAGERYSDEKRNPYQNDQGPGHVHAYPQGQPRYVAFNVTYNKFEIIEKTGLHGFLLP
jgi:hypothetical protein